MNIKQRQSICLRHTDINFSNSDHFPPSSLLSPLSKPLLTLIGTNSISYPSPYFCSFTHPWHIPKICSYFIIPCLIKSFSTQITLYSWLQGSPSCPVVSSIKIVILLSSLKFLQFIEQIYWWIISKNLYDFLMLLQSNKLKSSRKHTQNSDL